MEALHPDLPIRQLYPEDIYPNGACSGHRAADAYAKHAKAIIIPPPLVASDIGLWARKTGRRCAIADHIPEG